MTSLQANGDGGPAGPDGALRAVGLTAVCLGVAALAAATFVLSYQGIRDVALQADIGTRYARGYPLLIDAMLVIVLAAVLALRGAGLPSRLLSWLTLLAVLGAAAGADVLHATGRSLPHNAAVITAAVLPWGLVFVAFVLLLAILRHARLRRKTGAAPAQLEWSHPVADGQPLSQAAHAVPAQPLPVRTPQEWDSVSIVPGFSSQLVSSAAAGAAAGAAVAEVTELDPWAGEHAASDDGQSQHAGSGQEALAVQAPDPVTEPGAEDALAETVVPDADTGSAEAEADPPALAVEATVHSDEADPLSDEAGPQTDEPDQQTNEQDPQGDEPDPQTSESDPPTAADDDDMPVFHRI